MDGIEYGNDIDKLVSSYRGTILHWAVYLEDIIDTFLLVYYLRPVKDVEAIVKTIQNISNSTDTFSNEWWNAVKAGNNFKDMFNFNGLNGKNPNGYLTISGSVLYGMTVSGGAYDSGVIFKLDTTNIGNGIEQLAVGGGQWTVYPNPGNGKFTTEGYGVRDKGYVEIYNMMGQKIYSNQFNIQHSTFNVNIIGQPAGIYIYKLSDENDNFIADGKIIIER